MARPVPPRNNRKKSVKFSDSVDPTDPVSQTSIPLTTDEINHNHNNNNNNSHNQSHDQNNGVHVKENKGFPLNVKAFPLHLLLIAYGILQGDLEEGLLTNLKQYLAILTVVQLIYSVLFNGQLVEVRKNKIRTLFKLNKDYNLLFIGLIITGLLIIPVYFILVLFGAPFTTLLQENLLLACHLSILLYPVIITYLKIGDNKVIYKYVVSIALGSWIGAVVIPLDWDRPWQRWPLPIVIGGYIGAALGYSFGWLL